MQPSSELAQKVLPAPLYRALTHVFAQDVSGCMLVGGTALAGYYAGHRRSDDLDLFARDDTAFRATVLAVRSLARIGAQASEPQSSRQLYAGDFRLDGHSFATQVVLDPQVFVVGTAIEANDRVSVADLETLLKMKAATLVSQCSEKDLYDLDWLFSRFPELGLGDLIALGYEIDAGMNAEATLVSVISTELKVSACGFSPAQTAEQVLGVVEELRRNLITALDKAARQQPTPRLGALVRALRGSRRRAARPITPRGRTPA